MTLWSGAADGYRLRLVEHAPSFDRDSYYMDGTSDYADNPARFTLLGRAALEAIRAEARPVDVIHGHDWQAGPALLSLKYRYAADPLLAGAATNWCVRATAYGALDRGYDLTLLEDAHTTHTADLENGSTIKAEDIIRDLNRVMAWISYPGRTNGSVSVEDIDFAAKQ